MKEGETTVPTIKDLLRQVESGSCDSGACFGVTDPSRLRPVLHRTMPKIVCLGCVGPEHRCEKKVPVLRVTFPKPGRTRKRRTFVKCGCSMCNK